jgi:hypothetical protein
MRALDEKGTQTALHMFNSKFPTLSEVITKEMLTEKLTERRQQSNAICDRNHTAQNGQQLFVR